MDIDRSVPGTNMIFTPMFVGFKAPPTQFIFLDKKHPKTGQEPRYAVFTLKEQAYSSHKWCFVDRHCSHCNLTGHTLEDCSYDDMWFFEDIKAIQYVNHSRETPSSHHRSRVHREYTGRSVGRISPYMEGDENKQKLLNDNVSTDDKNEPPPDAPNTPRPSDQLTQTKSHTPRPHLEPPQHGNHYGYCTKSHQKWWTDFWE
eukprot:TRINITY_DN7799_c0_g1_i11.p1 TRINITY_DN7799_c0_g1~~TRINITY_DN7799_c0_g1_i11.p1  ORF type:complete len:201 (-),score=10.27 TRINITY_DN7799_c0_g1_i11:163-765(-)